MDRLEQQLRFVAEIDRLKHIVRKTLLLDESRCETSAEHSWQLALMAVVLGEYAPAGTDLGKVIEMVLVHDLVEIDAGDAYLWDEAAQAAKPALEERAAQRVFGLLPPDQGQRLRALWDEFEARETAEARFAVALDRFQPMLHNILTGGVQWHRHGITYSRVAGRATDIQAGSLPLYEHMLGRLRQARDEGVLPAD